MLHSVYLACERWGADVWAERITHRYECDQVVLVISDTAIRRRAKELGVAAERVDRADFMMQMRQKCALDLSM